jgi:hypothetical protein
LAEACSAYGVSPMIFRSKGLVNGQGGPKLTAYESDEADRQVNLVRDNPRSKMGGQQPIM